MYKLLTLISTLVFLISTLHAQPDTVRSEELPALNEGYKNSSITYFQRANSYSQMKDSAKAGKYLLMVDPYYLLWEWRNSERPDSFIVKWNLPPEIAEEVIRSYDSARMAEKSAYYIEFERMAEEDQVVRKRLTRCADTFTCRKIRELMRHTDTLHARYLYDFVQANGWPSIAEGSMYATTLAIHDHSNHSFYMPYLKKAVMNGQADMNALMLINHYVKSHVSHKEMLEEIRTKRNIRFDVSELLQESMPKSLPRIQKAFSDACEQKFKFYYIFEAPRNQIFSDWHDIHHSRGGMHIMEKFQKELQIYCKKKIFDPGVWYHSWIPENKTGLYMVIVYD